MRWNAKSYGWCWEISNTAPGGALSRLRPITPLGFGWHAVSLSDRSTSVLYCGILLLIAFSLSPQGFPLIDGADFSDPLSRINSALGLATDRIILKSW
jgi:hypothetical protein